MGRLSQWSGNFSITSRAHPIGRRWPCCCRRIMGTHCQQKMAFVLTPGLQIFTLWCKQYLMPGDKGPHSSSSRGQEKEQTSGLSSPFHIQGQCLTNGYLSSRKLKKKKKSSPKKPRRMHSFCPRSSIRCRGWVLAGGTDHVWPSSR